MAETEPTKFCRKCESDCPISEFKHGKSHCYTCQKKMSCDWKARNREHVAQYNKTYKEDNKESVKEYNSKYHAEHREQIKVATRETHRRLKKTCPNFKIAQTLRNRLYVAVRNATKSNASKSGRTLDILGCSMDTFLKWLQFNFSRQMTLENHGQIWHLDHVIPCSKFDLSKEQEVNKCFHWTNIQPLMCKDNLSKNNKVCSIEIARHEENLKSFINTLSSVDGQYTIVDINRLSYMK